jgi:hypothetical protein
MRVTYEVVEHDGGWAYKVGSVFSETFRTHQEAHRAAEAAAQRQHLEGQTTDIEFEDASGRWHTELAQGGDRPETEVEDDPGQPKRMSRDVGANEPLPNGPRRR